MPAFAGLKLALIGVRLVRAGPDADDRAGRRVANDGEVRVDGKLARADVQRPAIEHPAVRDVLPLVGESETLPVDGQGLLVVADLRQDERRRATRRAVVAIGDIDLVGRLAGGMVDFLHDADKGGGAIHHRRGALQHLDPLHVVHVQGGDHRVEGPAPGHAVDHQQEGVELVQAPERRHRARRPGVTPGRRLDPGNQTEGRGHVRGVAASQFAAGNHRNVDRNAVQRLGITRRGDHHRIERHGVRLRGVSRPGRGLARCGRRRHDIGREQQAQGRQPPLHSHFRFLPPTARNSDCGAFAPGSTLFARLNIFAR